MWMDFEIQTNCGTHKTDDANDKFIMDWEIPYFKYSISWAKHYFDWIKIFHFSCLCFPVCFVIHMAYGQIK